MPVFFNIFSGELDYVSTGALAKAKYSEVDTYADLPLASSEASKIYVVLTATGNWYTFDRRDAGLYYSDGSVWTRLGNTPYYFSSSNFRIQDGTDNTKQIAYDLTAIATGTTRTITVPNRDINLGNFFENGGNSFGGAATIGTNDAYDLTIKRGGTDAIVVNATTINIPYTTASSSTTTGALTIVGGLGLVGAANIGGVLSVLNTTGFPADIRGGQAGGNVLILVRNVSGANVNNTVGFDFRTLNDASSSTAVANILTGLSTITAGAEIGYFKIRTRSGGGNSDRLIIDNSSAIFTVPVQAISYKVLDFDGLTYKEALKAGTVTNVLQLGSEFTTTDIFSVTTNTRIARFLGVASADNYFEFRNSNGSPDLYLSGADTSIGMNIRLKGASAFQIVGQQAAAASFITFNNTITSNGASLISHYNSRTGHLSNTSEFRFVQLNASGAASVSSYIWGGSLDITNGSEKTVVGIDTLSAGTATRATRFSVSSDSAIFTVPIVTSTINGNYVDTGKLVSTDLTTTLSTAVPISDLDVSLEANSNYIVEVDLHVGCSTTNGIRIRLEGPTGATVNGYYFGSWSGSTAQVQGSITLLPGTLSAVHTQANDNGFIRLSFGINTGGTAGTLAILYHAQTAGDTAKIFSNSWIRVKRV